jgi:undecaprenyl-diphosphatase
VIVLSLISYPRAIILGALQGVTELFPVSSLGHAVIWPQLSGSNIHQNDSYYITFLVATHLATALVLLGFFWSDWVRIVKGLGRSLRDRGIGPDDTDAKLGWLLVVATIPVGILGVLLESKLKSVFASAQSAAFFLTVNGLILFAAEALRRRAPQTDDDDDTRIARQIGWWQAVGVGTAQAAALIPGISRSGVTMGAGSSSGSHTRTQHALPSFSQHPRSAVPRSSSSPSWRARTGMGCAARRSPVRSPRRSRRTSRFAS